MRLPEPELVLRDVDHLLRGDVSDVASTNYWWLALMVGLATFYLAVTMLHYRKLHYRRGDEFEKRNNAINSVLRLSNYIERLNKIEEEPRLSSDCGGSDCGGSDFIIDRVCPTTDHGDNPTDILTNLEVAVASLDCCSLKDEELNVFELSRTVLAIVQGRAAKKFETALSSLDYSDVNLPYLGTESLAMAVSEGSDGSNHNSIFENVSTDHTVFPGITIARQSTNPAETNWSPLHEIKLAKSIDFNLDMKENEAIVTRIIQMVKRSGYEDYNIDYAELTRTVCDLLVESQSQTRHQKDEFYKLCDELECMMRHTHRKAMREMSENSEIASANFEKNQIKLKELKAKINCQTKAALQKIEEQLNSAYTDELGKNNQLILFQVCLHAVIYMIIPFSMITSLLDLLFVLLLLVVHALLNFCLGNIVLSTTTAIFISGMTFKDQLLRMLGWWPLIVVSFAGIAAWWLLVLFIVNRQFSTAKMQIYMQKTFPSNARRVFYWQTRNFPNVKPLLCETVVPGCLLVWTLYWVSNIIQVLQL